jgi:hypothetical protein
MIKFNNGLMVRSLLIFLLVIYLLGCEGSARQTEPYSFTKLAMQPGMVIEATNKNGTVSIEYLSSLERRYKWNGQDEKRLLVPRKESWLGRIGAYDPATAYFWEIFDTRIVAEDSQVDFETMEDVEQWLYQGSAVLDWVYTDDGLVIGFAKTSSRNQVNIEVYQFYINGKKPSKLKGSRSKNINVSSSTLK